MLWRKKKQGTLADGERNVDMGGTTQSITNIPNPTGAGGIADGEPNVDQQKSGALPPGNDGQPPRFQIKRWSACVYWSWDVMHDTCVICRNAMMSLCIHCQAKVGTNPLDEVCAIAWGVCNHAYHLHCIKRWLETSAHPRCPLDNSEWEFSRIGQ